MHRLQIPLAFLKKDFYNEISYRFHFMIQIFGIFFATLSFYFLSKLVDQNASSYLEPYGGNYLAFVLIGLAFSHYMLVSLSGFSEAIRETQMMGIMEILLISQARLSTIILSSSIYKFLFTSFRIVVYLLMGALIFHVDLSNANYPGALFILLLTIVSLSCIGIISASFIMVFKKGDPIAWGITALSWLIGGVYYPISVLPPWLQKLSWLLPVTPALEGMRMALLRGYSFPQLLPTITALVVFSFIMMPFSLLVFRIAVKKAKIDGSLTQY